MRATGTMEIADHRLSGGWRLATHNKTRVDRLDGWQQTLTLSTQNGGRGKSPLRVLLIMSVSCLSYTGLRYTAVTDAIVVVVVDPSASSVFISSAPPSIYTSLRSLRYKSSRALSTASKKQLFDRFPKR